MVRLAVVLGALCAAGCVERELAIRLELVTETCDPTGTAPLEGVTHLEFRVTGSELVEPLVRLALASAHAVELPAIPAGRGRVIEVRGYERDPQAGGLVVALGRTAPFEVPEVVPLPGEGVRELRIFIRRVDSLVPTNLS